MPKVYPTLTSQKDFRFLDMFFTRAKLNPADAMVTIPTLENLQAVIILTLVQSHGESGGGYLLCGLAVRMAQDMGMTRNMDKFKNIPSTSLYRLHVRKKAFCAVFVLDRILSALLGRSLTLNSDEIDVDFPSESDEAEVMASFLTNEDPQVAESIKRDAMRQVSDFNQLIKLSDILVSSCFFYDFQRSIFKHIFCFLEYDVLYNCQSAVQTVGCFCESFEISPIPGILERLPGSCQVDYCHWHPKIGGNRSFT